jgi:hypothetical protein
MSGFDTKTYERDAALQHRHSVVKETGLTPIKWGEPMPLLWGEILHMQRRVSELRAPEVTKWLKQTFQSWKSVFRRPPRLIPERGNRLQTR